MHNYNIKSVGWQFIFQSKFTAPHKCVHFSRRHNKKQTAVINAITLDSPAISQFYITRATATISAPVSSAR